MPRFTIDISDELNTWLTQQARLNHRSKNKQIEHFLMAAAQCAQCGGTGQVMITVGEFESCRMCGGSGVGWQR